MRYKPLVALLAAALGISALPLLVPAVANASTCSDPPAVFCGVKYQINASDLWMGENGSNVLQNNENDNDSQAWDGYRDSGGNLIYYVHDSDSTVLEDSIGGSTCYSSFADCPIVDSTYTDAGDQQWTRIVSGGNTYIQTLATNGNSKVIDDPDASKVVDRYLVMYAYTN